MQYVLGNMLNGAGGLNADGLALDLQFAADKTLTARKGPTPVFTRGSTGTFVGSNGLIQTAAVNAARFDHDPVTLASRGLLIEESRTNLILQSENFASGTWAKTGGSISSVANVEPDGSANSELFSEDGTTGTHRIFQSFTGTIGTVYTLNVFLKFNGRAEIFLENRSIGTNPLVVFNIQNGTIGFVSSGLTAAIQAYPNGWYRCSITGTATSAGGNYLIGGYSGGNQTYTGLNGPAFYLYGAQVEAGSSPTSYIPTTTGSVVRSADVCSISGASFSGMWNQPEGTFLSRTQKTSTNPNAFVISASDGGFNNETDLRYNSVSQVAALINVSGASQVTGVQANITSGSEVKQSIAYKLNDCAYAANGASPILDTSALIPTVDRLTIGNVAVTGQAFYLNGTISSIRYYRKRLPNAKLVTLTT
jgi:hypothetical protein